MRNTLWLPCVPEAEVGTAAGPKCHHRCSMMSAYAMSLVLGVASSLFPSLCGQVEAALKLSVGMLVFRQQHHM